MPWMTAAITFAAGALTSATVNQLVARFFAEPRLDCAVSDLSMSRTRLRFHKGIRVTDNLRLLLAEHSTSDMSWGELFVSEEQIDRSILDLYEYEINVTHSTAEMQRILARLSPTTAKDCVGEIGRNQHLILGLVNACLDAVSELPQVPDAAANEPVVFPLVKREMSKDGESLEFVHLDLPGNPSPVVGSLSGRPETNKKVAALAYALSRCNESMLREILRIAIRLSSRQVNHAARLRSELERIKTETVYLELELVITNRGGTSGFVATTADLAVGGNRPIHLAAIEFVEGAEKQAAYVEIRDHARRVLDTEPRLAQALGRYESLARYLVVQPGQPHRVKLVSVFPIDRATQDAVQAIRTGYTACDVTITQYIPRRHSWLGHIAKFERRLTTTQQVRSSQPSA